MEELKQILKNELFITWEDEETEKRLERTILNAIPTLNHKIGADVDYFTNGIEQNLFINYCVYVYNGKADEFDTNYQHEISQIRIIYEVQNLED